MCEQSVLHASDSNTGRRLQLRLLPVMGPLGASSGVRIPYQP